MTSNHVMSRSLAAVLAVSVLMALLPYMSHAQERERGTGERGGGANFCENLSAAEDRVLASIESRAGSASDRHGSQETDYESKRSERLAELETKRDDADNRRDVKYAELRERADTDAEQDAVDEFEETVEGLVATRRAAIDDAIDAFEAAVEALKDSRGTEVEDFVDDLEIEIKSAFGDAEEACDTTDDPADIRADLQEAIKAIRESYKSRRGGHSFKEDLAEARETRQAAFEAAKADFMSGLEDAKEELKAAFGE